MTPPQTARAVTLRLSDFAFLKAAPDWTHTNAMVRLGARAPANNNRAPGSVYGLYGGNLDGAGRATGISTKKFFADTVGFADNGGNNSYVRCYSDQFAFHPAGFSLFPRGTRRRVFRPPGARRPEGGPTGLARRPRRA